jgi:hypothetical protein
MLEDEEAATKRGKKAYAKIRSYKQGSSWSGSGLDATLLRILSELKEDCRPTKVFASGDGDAVISEAENKALGQTSFETIDLIRPKSNIGNLFAAAAAAQFALAAVFTSQQAIGRRVLANCFGYGTEQASFMLESSCTEL